MQPQQGAMGLAKRGWHQGGKTLRTLTQHLQSAALCEPQDLALSSGSVRFCARSGGRWEKPWRTGTLLPTLHQN